MFTEFDQFFEFYISEVRKQVPDYKKYLPDYKQIHPLFNPLTQQQVNELNIFIRSVIKLPKNVDLRYDRNAFTFYSWFDEVKNRPVISYPTVTYWFKEYPEIIKGAIKHEMGHIINKDIFVNIAGHSDCLNRCMDARINMHIPHKDLDELTRCLFAFKNTAGIRYVKADDFYEKIHLPIVEGGYSWETAHVHYHLFDMPQVGGSCGMPRPDGEMTEGEGECDPSEIDDILDIFGDKPEGEESEGEGEGDDNGDGQGDGEGNGKEDGEEKAEEGKEGEGKKSGKEGEAGQPKPNGDATKASREMKKLDKQIQKAIATLEKLKRKY